MCAGHGTPAQAQIFQFSRAEAVRQDVPGLEPRLDWIRDEAPVYDKRSFRVLAGDDYEPESAFVRFLPGTPDTARGAAHALAGIGDVLWTSRLVSDLHLVRVDRFDVEQTIQRYLDHPDTLYAEPSYRARPGLDSNDPSFVDGTQWGMQGGQGPSHGGSNAEFAWDEHRGSNDITIAVIDSGVDFVHPDLAGNHRTNSLEVPDNGEDDDKNGFIDDLHGWDFSSLPGDNIPLPDCSDHGTHVAGTVGAQGDNNVGVVGVSWDCLVMALKCQTPGDCNFISNAPLALDYAVANGARVSNHSYGGPSFNQAAYDLILASQAFGHLVVAAAGNDWVDTDVTPLYPSCYDLDNIISVANIEDDGDLY
ncbi:Thermophilic serine proteinase precursor [Planctomycetes bacterium Pla86]|uniref:Thermophilic serine proteinase n=1 Tax=Engelhardtia mirabilis TaxID=2528011 RepID=A0A518BFU8_9BACT|nr:Thermophilic serine proteinase precursor [Planctomycetes bacterium Pla133]QDV00183.1 Thermophilic serine proteinase precursor [Planctomycetes bacterium Pla86]